MNGEETRDTDAPNSARSEDQLTAEAMEWLARGELTHPEERERFMSWISQSPEHVKAFLASKYWRDGISDALATLPLDVKQLLAGSTNVIDVTDRVPAARTRAPRLRWKRAGLMAAGVAALAAVVLLATPLARELWTPDVYSTALGEQRSVALDDGSVITMNTQSRVRVRYSSAERNIYLSAGQATFAVAHDPGRPFRVHVDTGVIEAIGTRFDVRRLANRTSVAVLEGRVKISSPNGAHPGDAGPQGLSAFAQLGAGEGASISNAGDVTSPSRIDVGEVSAWQQRRLVFVDDTLKDIVDEFHRYTRVRLRIEGDELAARRYSGVWDADRPDKLLTYLRAYGNVTVDRNGEEYIIRATGSSSTTR